jgi:hypothetical protein
VLITNPGSESSRVQGVTTKVQSEYQLQILISAAG